MARRERGREEWTASDYARSAREQLGEFAGVEVENVSGVERADDGWEVTLEVLELARIPDTVSLLATYVVGLDDEGRVERYRRVRRYTRGRPDRV
ncbi:gas vesicle protein GvpO [Actinorugispora endophytica]|uniref:Gas vesicle protein GvpO n=1 Tax=Actinorugispora endophytica TaxID=1605990 RepID=A0A4R6V8B4_9ACTN|nr:gas vesicle protein GvpO [Actinorugispora endophytica]TDQ55386.1 gas vesicle protein GvpO [Actinorugispora endophytica]